MMRMVQQPTDQEWWRYAPSFLFPSFFWGKKFQPSQPTRQRG